MVANVIDAVVGRIYNQYFHRKPRNIMSVVGYYLFSHCLSDGKSSLNAYLYTKLKSTIIPQFIKSVPQRRVPRNREDSRGGKLICPLAQAMYIQSKPLVPNLSYTLVGNRDGNVSIILMRRFELRLP